MNHTLDNGVLHAQITDRGAELQTLQKVDTQEHYLWHGAEQYWSGRSPVLFPIVGALRDEHFTHDGVAYALPRHGFARRSLFMLESCSPTSCEFALRASTETRAVYPWEFELKIRYALHDNILGVSYTISNLDTVALYCSIGAHPAFVLSDELPQYAVHFNKPETLLRYPLDSDGLLAESGISYPLVDQSITLQGDTFADDALVFKQIKSRHISLLHRGKQRLTVDTGGAPDLGIWSKPGAPFVCIEPWFGYSDSNIANRVLADKAGIITVNAGEHFMHRWSIAIH